MIVKNNNKIITNWNEYLYDKFSNHELYNIEREANKRGYLIKSKTNNTIIWFYINDNNVIEECQYNNSDRKGWSSELIFPFCGWGEFNQSSVDKLNNILITPIEKGWISIDYYLRGKLYKSKTYFDQNKNSKPFQSLNNNIGCYFFIFFPFYFLVTKLIENNIIGQKKEIVIHPIEKNYQLNL